ncbi:STAS domain-containing protein [Antribacter sp. KLBMP9083]|jgi:anti-sigma B factor antagonist|uniref:Anti-sigma factor antagonist n=1 Tax=Antribacter soli TaxID=2910976 RepID=A0AA41QAT0_9MICO|nr:STAS domain-containing protein [Antribacter soli]MCF4119843.1 STAS domain-containing protein [Antribacter soli]
MEFKTEELGKDITLVRGNGRLNMIAAPRLRSVVAYAVENGRPRVVVDLSEVEFMDSSGLGSLISCLKTVRQAGGDLRIAAPATQVSMVLSLSNVDRILKPYAVAETAFDD